MTKPTVADGALVVGLCLLGVFGALVGFAYLPWTVRWPGTSTAVQLPISVLIPGVLAVALPWLAFRLTRSLLIAAAPVVAIFVAMVVLLLAPNELYSFPLRVVSIDAATRKASDNDWRNLLLLGVIALSAAVSLSLLWAKKVSTSAHRPVTPITPDRARARPGSSSGDTGGRSAAEPSSD